MVKMDKNKKISKFDNPMTDGFVGEFKEVSDEQISIRNVETTDGKKYHVVQENPWQLWKVVDKNGKEMLKGEKFTSERRAEEALEKYLNA